MGFAKFGVSNRNSELELVLYRNRLYTVYILKNNEIGRAPGAPGAAGK